MSRVRVALVGVGNCASALVQGVQYYRDAAPNEQVAGLMHVQLGKYHVRDIEFTAGFDVSAHKVGKDLCEAIFAPPNNTLKFADVPFQNAPVYSGPLFDGVSSYTTEAFAAGDFPQADIVQILRDTQTDVVVNYLPVGSEEATRWYAEQAIEAGCAFINCIPVFIASDAAWQEKFKQAGLPIIGDDIKSQVGATIVHRMLVDLFNDRGVHIDRTYQLNFGGNTDFNNMLDRSRLQSKRISKTQSVTSRLPYDIGENNVHVGPSDYVPWLEDRKWASIRVEGRGFGDAPLNVELKLEVWDSPNSAGVVVDAIRCAKLALDHGVAGAVLEPSSYLMKSPPVQYSDKEARDRVEQFIQKYGSTK
jgi:myo-inositol-1-phosphate synthase